MEKQVKTLYTNSLRKLLDQEGFTQADLHDKIHTNGNKVTIATINKICTGRNLTPSEVTMTKITKGLNALLGSDKYKKEEIFKPL